MKESDRLRDLRDIYWGRYTRALVQGDTRLPVFHRLYTGYMVRYYRALHAENSPLVDGKGAEA